MDPSVVDYTWRVMTSNVEIDTSTGELGLIYEKKFGIKNSDVNKDKINIMVGVIHNSNKKFTVDKKTAQLLVKHSKPAVTDKYKL